MPERPSKLRAKTLLIRSVCIVVLLGFSYRLQRFDDSLQTSVADDTYALLPTVPDQPEFRLSQTDLNQARKRLKNGDIIFRSGNTWLSNMAERVAQEVTYTHVGIITRRGSQISVVHASIEGDSIVETLDNHVIEESLTDFLQKGNTNHAIVYRLKDYRLKDPAAAEEVANDVAAAAHVYAKNTTPFDSGFDLSTSDKVYCTELIWRVYLDAGVDLADQGLESFSFPFSGRYLMPDALSKSEHLQPIYQFNQIRAVQS